MPSNNRKIVAIHQPNFFPWLGYFDKIARSDTFIFMDNAQFPKTGGTWINRVRLLLNGSAAWVTVPVIRSYSGFRLIHEMEINDLTDWRGKFFKTIQANYAKAPFYKQSIPLISELVNNPTKSIADFNIQIITRFCAQLGIDAGRLVRGSTLDTRGTSTDLLISMTKTVSGNIYMCGGGSEGYQEDDKFSASGVELRYQTFSHPVYAQTRTSQFVAGLSILDAVFNIGFEELSYLIVK